PRRGDALAHPVAAGRRRQLRLPAGARNAGGDSLLAGSDGGRTLRAAPARDSSRWALHEVGPLDVRHAPPQAPSAHRGVRTLRRVERGDRTNARHGDDLVLRDTPAVTRRLAAAASTSR